MGLLMPSSNDHFFDILYLINSFSPDSHRIEVRKETANEMKKIVEHFLDGPLPQN